MSRVIHLRMPEEDLLSCYELLDNLNQNPKNMPTSTCVAKALNLLLGSLRHSGELPIYARKETILTNLSEYMGKNVAGPGTLSLASLHQYAQTEPSELPEPEEVTEEDFHAHLDRQIADGAGSGRATARPDEPEGELDEAPQRPVWETERYYSVHYLEKEYPKDRFVESYSEMPDSKEKDAFGLALGIVYRNMPSSLWNSPKADEFIKDLYSRVLQDMNQFPVPAKWENSDE